MMDFLQHVAWKLVEIVNLMKVEVPLILAEHLDLFYSKVKFGNLGLSIGKSENSIFFRNYCSL